MIDKIFNVATEFRFEIGSALVQSKALQDAANGINEAVSTAMATTQQFGLSIAASFGIANYGLIGLLQKSVFISDKFQKSQIAFAAGLAANKDKLTGPIQSFNEQLQFSQFLLEEIGKASIEYGLDEEAFVNYAKLLSPMLTSKGLAGTNQQNVLDISRGVLKAAPVLNVEPFMVTNQLLEIIEGRASGQNTLFSRLANDTPVFKNAHVNTAVAFNAKKAEERVKLLSDALAVFSSNTEVVNANVNTLTGQMTQLRNFLFGPVSSIFRPLGDELRITIVDILKKTNDWIKNYGKDTVLTLTKFITPWLRNLEGSYINLKQFSSLKSNFEGIKHLGHLFITFEAIKFLIMNASKLPKLFGIGQGLVDMAKAGEAAGKIVGSGVKQTATLFGGAAAAAQVQAMTFFGFLKMFAVTLTRIFGWVGIALLGLQLLSRARAIAQVENTKYLAQGGVNRFLEMSQRITRAVETILRPITYAWDRMARTLSWFWEFGGFLDFLASIVEQLTKFLENLALELSLVYSVFEALSNAIIYFVQRVFSGQWKNLGSDIADVFVYDFKEAWKKNTKQLYERQDGMVSPNVQNVYVDNVSIQNAFKEQLEPDRIAFTIREQLLGAATNRTTGRGVSVRDTGVR